MTNEEVQSLRYTNPPQRQQQQYTKMQNSTTSPRKSRLFTATSIKTNSTNASNQSGKSNTSNKSMPKWHLWWYGSNSNIRVPFYDLPNYRGADPKIGSLENINHRPGGGNANILNSIPKWSRNARIDHKWKEFKRHGGDKKIFSQKVVWNTDSKIKSLENINHVPGGGDAKILSVNCSYEEVRPKIDSGIIYEDDETASPYYDYQELETNRNTISEQDYDNKKTMVK